jgi:hypothetical protein
MSIINNLSSFGGFFYGILVATSSKEKSLKMKFMKSWLTLAMLGWFSIISAQSNFGEVVGTVVEKETGKSVYGAQVFILDQGQKYAAVTGPDGRFRISAVPSGTYDVNVKLYSDTMYGNKHKLTAKVPIDGFANLGTIKFTSEILTLSVVTVKAKDDSYKLVYGELPRRELTAEEIDKSPLKFDVKGLVTTMSSEVRLTEDGELVFRGARKGDMLYLMDGVKTSEIGNVPGVAIGRMMVYTGGLPAKYGDTLGGVVVLETKSYFDLYRSWKSEQIKKGLD